MEATIDQASEQLVAEVTDVAARVQALAVSTAEDYSAAGAELKIIKAFQKRLDDQRRNLTRPLDEVKARIIAFFDPPVKRLAGAEAALKRAMLDYSSEQERLAREAQRIANEKAEAEREVLRRQQAAVEEAARKEQARLAAQAEAARKRGDEAAALKADTKALEKQEAAAVKVEAYAGAVQAVVAPVVAVAAPVAAGVSYRETWKFEVTDASLVPREFMAPDLVLIGGIVKAKKGDASIPGVRIWAEKTAVVR